MRRAFFVRTAILIGLSCSALFAMDQEAEATELPSTISSNTTLSAAGSPYTGGTVTIANGATVTVEPGAVFKLTSLYVHGNLNAVGTDADPITFTSIKDDSAGGDTNNDGAATQPAAGDWGKIEFAQSGGGVLDETRVRYGGPTGSASGYSMIRILCPCSTPATVTNSTISHSRRDAIAVSGNGAPQITHNHVHHNQQFGINVGNGGAPEIAFNEVSDNWTGIYYAAGNAVQGQVNIHDNVVTGGTAGTAAGRAAIQVITLLSAVQPVSLGDNRVEGNQQMGMSVEMETLPADVDDNVISDNTKNGLWLSGAVADSTTWQDRGYPYVLTWAGVTVAANKTLTLEPGVTVKAESAKSLTVNGDLQAVGVDANPITFTSISDDSADGDTNADGGLTSPAAGNWREIRFNAGATGYLRDTRIRYGGASAYSGSHSMVAIWCPCPIPARIRHSRLTDSSKDAVTLRSDIGTTADGGPAVSRNVFRRIAQNAISKGAGSQLVPAPYNDFGCDSGPAPSGCGEPVTAQIDPRPWAKSPADDGPCRGGEKTQCPHGSDPVSLSSGAFTYSHTDLSLSNKAGTPLAFTRTYNSLDDSDAGLGPGWSHQGLIQASELESGDVMISRSDGRQDIFSLSGGAYSPPSGVHDELTKNPNATFKFEALDRTLYEFDATGRIDKITDDHGLVTDYVYDSGGRLASITDASAQTLTFTYNSSNRITKATDSSGRFVSYAYTADNRLDTVTDALGGVTDYGYDPQGRLTTIKDPRGVTFLTNVYDGQGRVVEQRDGLSNLWALEYFGDHTVVTEPEGGEISYGFDSQGRLVSETDQLGHTTTYGYDAAGNRDRITRPGATITALDYDAAGNVVSATDPEGGERTYTYDSLNRVATMTDERLKTWAYTWNAANDLTEIDGPGAADTEIAYNAAGQPTEITDPNNHVTTLAYDTRGNLTSQTNPEGEQTTLAYNAKNQLTALTRPGLAPEAYARNALGDLLSITTPEGHLTSFGYDQNGALTQVTDPALETWTIERNAMERPTAYVDPLANRTETTYDANLNPVSVTDRRLKTTTYAYDLANRLTEIDAPATGDWLFGYDARGNRDEMTDPRSNTTTYEYDLADRLTDAHEPLATNTAYAYDPAGNLTSVTDPRSNQTSFTYDDLARMTEIAQPLAKSTSFAYDPAGNLTSRTTAEDTLSLAYDDADRLTEISEGASVLRGFAYDDAGRLTEATDSQAKTIALGYDDDDNLISIADGRGQTVSRTFDSRANLTAQTDARGTLVYVYDELNRMTQLTDPQSQVSTFDYDPEGNLTETALPNGVTTTNAYDDAGRMASTESANGATVLQSFDYAYDLAGNRASQTDRNQDQTTYAYDGLNRLTEFDPPAAPAVGYGFDAAGNRTSADGVSSTFNALNQITASSDGQSFEYDGAGRLVERSNGSQTTAYTYDPLDQLTEVDDGQNPIAYSYDALGRRAERSEGSATETAHYGDFSDLATLDTDATGVLRSWIQGPAGLLEQRQGSLTEFPLADAHGDVMAIADAAGAVSTRQEFDPWGEQLAGPALEMGWLGSQQRRFDPAARLVQMGVRSYSPALGRFLSEDPVVAVPGFGQTVDRHSYVASNPLNWHDLTGRCADVFAMLCSWAEDPLNFGDPTEMVTAAQDQWVHSDSPIANIAGPAVTMTDLAVNPDRLGAYIKPADEFWEEYLNFSIEELIGNVGVGLTEYGICELARKPAARYGALMQLGLLCGLTEGLGAYGAVTDIHDDDNSLWTDDLFD